MKKIFEQTCAIWAAIVTADTIVEKFGGDALCDTLANLKNYRARLEKDYGL